MNKNQRISLNDDLKTCLIKLAEGNPGALTAMIEMCKISEEIDFDSAFGPYTPLINLDDFGIYGTDIYVLWNDICDRDTIKTIGVLRATQMGLFDNNILKDAAHRQDRSGKSLVPVDELMLKLMKKLPNFNKDGRAQEGKEEKNSQKES